MTLLDIRFIAGAAWFTAGAVLGYWLLRWKERNVRDALAMARERGLDLIEVAPQAVPPICRIMDYGKHKYDQAKKDRDVHKKQKGGENDPAH